MSGRIALHFGAERRPDAIALFHGGLYVRDYEGSFEGQAPVTEFLPKIACPVLGQFGEIDPRVPLPNVRRFRTEMEDLRKSYEVHVYPNTDHAWLNDRLDSYRPAEAAEAWKVFVGFLKDVFDGQWTSDRAIWRFSSDTSVDYDLEQLRQQARRGGQERLS